MANLDLTRTSQLIQQFDFARLFIEELGWSRPAGHGPLDLRVRELQFRLTYIAELGGVVVLEVAGSDGAVPDAKVRAALHKEVSKRHHENLLIFLDSTRTQSLWYWVKREEGKNFSRDHLYFKGQPTDLFLSKLQGMVFDIGDFDAEGNVGVVEVSRRLRDALDIERVTKKFFREFQDQHIAFLDLIEGISDDRQRRWYASVLLNRLMFIYFLQKKFFLDGGNDSYLQDKLADSQKHGKNLFFRKFLTLLFFEGFAKPEEARSAEAKKCLGKIRYLNGGLFLPHTIEQQNPKIQVPDKAFENLFGLFGRYSWNLDDTPGGKADEINPDVLGYIFEKYINQKAFGAYYTRPEITRYLCERTIHRLILGKVNKPAVPELNLSARQFDSVEEMLLRLDAGLCNELLNAVPKLSLLDPACGSGAFLVAAMKSLVNIYGAIIGRIKVLNDAGLNNWLRAVEKEHPSVSYFIHKTIITRNLYGVDIMEEAAEIAKLRLFLALVATARKIEELEPLPNIDFNVLPGNSLIGLIHVDDTQFDARSQGDMFRKSYRRVLEEKDRLISVYRNATEYAEDLRSLRDSISKHKEEAQAVLNELLLREFADLGIKFEEVTWDVAEGKEGKSKKRNLTLADIKALQPFHWGYEFDEILNQRGGFDAILTNPPWEIFKPNGKEFFEQHSDLVSKKKMSIHDFEKEQDRLLMDAEIRRAWEEYLSSYPHLSKFFRNAPQFKNQISIVNGKKAGSDINLYKLFTEQCYNLLRAGGELGIVIPSGIYTDLGTKQLREMMFAQTRISGLFCFENRKEVFEGVDSRFKFVVLTLEKSGATETFPAAFMRHEVGELERFPRHGAIELGVELVRRLSPDSLSVMEFKGERDVQIAEKMLRYPLLGEQIAGKWNVRFTAEFHMTNDSGLFKTTPGKGRLPLYEGKMIWQFDHKYERPRYWVDEREGRGALLGRDSDEKQRLDYQAYRLGFRDIASNTNERTLVSSIIPPAFHGNKLPTVVVYDDGRRIIEGDQQLLLGAVWNSFVLDYLTRMKVTTTLNFFYMYQLPVPRLTTIDPPFKPIVRRAAKLICTTEEFDDLWAEIQPTLNLGSRDRECAVEFAYRARLRAELDGLIAHLYGLTEEEFAHVLSAFPLVPEPVLLAARNAYRDVEKGVVQ